MNRSMRLPTPLTREWLPTLVRILDATLVGRRVLALWGDSDEEPPRFEWFGATIVKFRAGPRIQYRFVMHFDDGATELVQLPDETVQILDETVSLCTCERCVTCEDAGRTLPLI